MPRLDWSGRRPAPSRPIAKVGDVVVPDQRPEGDPYWRVIDVPPAAAGRDVATLQSVDPARRPQKIRRWLDTLTLSKESP